MSEPHALILRIIQAERDVLYAIVRDLAGGDELEFGVSCPWHCVGDERGAGHDPDNCPYAKARAFLASSPEGDTE